MMPGLEASVRYEYFDNTDLRSGLDRADRSAFSYPNDDEVQRETLNRSAWLGLDYVGGPSWGVTAQLPFYDRFHSTIAAGDTEVSESRASGLGDMRIVARYQTFNPSRSFGVQFGFKLPTGSIAQTFATGPEAGTPLDRGLQLGTGTTDVLAGLSYFRRPLINLGCFAQVLLDQPLNYRDGFIPSTNLGLNAGLRYLNTSSWTPQLQLNVHWDGRERGLNADFANSGDSMAYLSPGVTAELSPKASSFLFVQIPVYQRVNGLQLEPPTGSCRSGSATSSEADVRPRASGSFGEPPRQRIPFRGFRLGVAVPPQKAAGFLFLRDRQMLMLEHHQQGPNPAEIELAQNPIVVPLGVDHEQIDRIQLMFSQQRFHADRRDGLLDQARIEIRNRGPVLFQDGTVKGSELLKPNRSIRSLPQAIDGGRAILLRDRRAFDRDLLPFRVQHG